jgi:hypothetical protein
MDSFRSCRAGCGKISPPNAHLFRLCAGLLTGKSVVTVADPINRVACTNEPSVDALSIGAKTVCNDPAIAVEIDPLAPCRT